MSAKIPWPNTRLTQTGLGNPLFVTDPQNNTENILQAVNMLLGLPSNGFAILSGFTYTPGSPGSYSPGIVYMNGQIYLVTISLTENKYLAPDPTDIDPKQHSDGNSYNTYRVFYAVQSNSPVGGMPQFVGNMNQYRRSVENLINITLGGDVNFAETLVTRLNLKTNTTDLGTAAFKDTGVTFDELPLVGANDLVASCYVKTDIDNGLATKSVEDVKTEILSDAITGHAWINLTVNSPWDLSLSGGNLQYKKDSFGMVHLRLTNGLSFTGNNATSIIIATLPTGYRPTYIAHSAISGQNLNVYTQDIIINSSGEITIGNESGAGLNILINSFSDIVFSTD
jgi:hypothetical protein